MWYVYILECHDKTFYTGITNDFEKRLAAHMAGTGAKYTRGRGPFNVVFKERHPDRALASKREYVIKKLSRAQKKLLFLESL